MFLTNFYITQPSSGIIEPNNQSNRNTLKIREKSLFKYMFQNDIAMKNIFTSEMENTNEIAVEDIVTTPDIENIPFLNSDMENPAMPPDPAVTNIATVIEMDPECLVSRYSPPLGQHVHWVIRKDSSSSSWRIR